MKRMILAVSVLILLSLACATLTGGGGNNTNTSGTEEERQPEETPTPTTAGLIEVKPTAGSSKCDGLSGEIEMQVLVGPAEVVGLPPISMGELPFTVEAVGGAYTVQGGGGVTYQETLTEAWGTYSVSFDMQGTIVGDCEGDPGNEKLNLTVEMSGEQMVEVRAEGFQGDYPWSGSHSMDLTFPLENGASIEGEGWAFILHLSE